MGQAKTLHTHRVLLAPAYVNCYDCIPKGFETEVFYRPGAIPVAQPTASKH